MVFIHTNNFRNDLPQYFKNCVIELPEPTNDTMEIVHYAFTALHNIYREGYLFKKAGVIITEIVPNNAIQRNLFSTTDKEKQKRLMNVVDKLNKGFTKNKLSLAVQGTNKKWNLKQELLSPRYTTKLSDIININCK